MEQDVRWLMWALSVDMEEYPTEDKTDIAHKSEEQSQIVKNATNATDCAYREIGIKCAKCTNPMYVSIWSLFCGNCGNRIYYPLSCNPVETHQP